jgi:hypothetical protein
MNSEKPKSPWSIEKDSPLGESIANEERALEQQGSLADSIIDRLNHERVKYEAIPHPDPRDGRVAFKILEGIPNKFRAIFEEEVQKFNENARKCDTPHFAKITGDEYFLTVEVVEELKTSD